MHFVAMLGFTLPGQRIGYSVPVTILSMLIAAVVVSTGLVIIAVVAGTAAARVDVLAVLDRVLHDEADLVRIYDRRPEGRNNECPVR